LGYAGELGSSRSPATSPTTSPASTAGAEKSKGLQVSLEAAHNKLASLDRLARPQQPDPWADESRHVGGGVRLGMPVIRTSG
jgi:hypothetical protein